MDQPPEPVAHSGKVECLYRKEKPQATIWVTITDATPTTIAALLADPRADHNQPSPTPPNCGELAQDPMCARCSGIMVHSGV
jgi:hypothetical protein